MQYSWPSASFFSLTFLFQLEGWALRFLPRLFWYVMTSSGVVTLHLFWNGIDSGVWSTPVGSSSVSSFLDAWSPYIIMAILVKSHSAQVFISQNASIIMFRGSSWSKKQHVDRVKLSDLVSVGWVSVTGWCFWLRKIFPIRPVWLAKARGSRSFAPALHVLGCLSKLTMSRQFM